eukprot:gene25831-biopygen4534
MATWRHPVPVPQARPLQGPQLPQAPGITDSALARVLGSEWRKRIPAKPVSRLVGTPSGSDMAPWRHHQEVGIAKVLMDSGACWTPQDGSCRLGCSIPRPPGSPIWTQKVAIRRPKTGIGARWHSIGVGYGTRAAPPGSRNFRAVQRQMHRAPGLAWADQMQKVAIRRPKNRYCSRAAPPGSRNFRGFGGFLRLVDHGRNHTFLIHC